MDPFQRKSTIIPPIIFYTLYILTRKLVPLMQSYVRSYVHAHVRTHVGRTHTRRFWSSLIDCVRITLTRACVLSNSRFFLSTIIENVGINQIKNTPTNIYDIFVSPRCDIASLLNFFSFPNHVPCFLILIFFIDNCVRSTHYAARYVNKRDAWSTIKTKRRYFFLKVFYSPFRYSLLFLLYFTGLIELIVLHNSISFDYRKLS